MIHRDHRKAYESSSALGQIIGRDGPLNLTVSDVDCSTLKILMDQSNLLRFIEQKQPKHGLRDGQLKILRLLDALIQHAKSCAAASQLRINARSGVFIVRGEIAGETSGLRKTGFRGPQEVERISDGEKAVLRSHEQFFRFLDPEDIRRRARMAWKMSA